MNRLLFLTIAIAAMTLTGCSKDEGHSNDNAKLFGKWEVQREMIKTNPNGEWRTDKTYGPQEYFYVFTKEGYGVYGGGLGDVWDENWREYLCIYELNLDKMVIFLQLAYPEQKIYKLTDTEFELEQPTFEPEYDYYESKLVMKRIE